MMDNEEILDLQTSKPKIVKLEHVRKVSKKRRPFDERKHIQNFVLYVVDSIISMVFVAPAVVSFWRGTWELLDTYTHFFPPYKTGILGIVLHICFILIRQFVRDYCENNNKKAKRHPLLVITRRFYTYMYSVTSVIQWRGCWTAFDNLFVNNKEVNLWMIILPTVSSLFVLIMFKSLTNTLATPCILILDSVEACYNIPTRFRIVIILLLAFGITKQNSIYIPYSKKIDLSDVINHNAHPFRNKIRGSIPSAFTASAPNPRRTTPLPRNIQDVIRNSELPTTEAQQNYNSESSIVDYRTNDPFDGHGVHDPFHSFKPQDISEVNLLAVANVRFAPPLWVDLEKDKKHKHILKRSLKRRPIYGTFKANIYS